MRWWNGKVRCRRRCSEDVEWMAELRMGVSSDTSMWCTEVQDDEKDAGAEKSPGSFAEGKLLWLTRREWSGLDVEG